MSDFESTLWTLILEARAGQEHALRDFILRYRTPVVAYCARRGLASEAEDLAQEVFLRLFRDGVLLKADPSKGRFRNLLLAVTKHVIGNHLEREHAEKRGGGHVQPISDLDVAASEPADDDFDREWVTHLLEKALARLAREHSNYHEALRQFLMDGRSYAEISKTIGKSEGEIKNYIFRGKAKLTEFLKEEVREYSATHVEYDQEIQYLSRFLPIR
jgi:RNA polymerase sigma-70 factor (ECF subfamily)